MTSQAPARPVMTVDKPPPPVETETPPRAFLAQAIHDTLDRWGARIGLLWIGILAFAAIFAPLLANSHPLAMESGGQWSSPLLNHLTWADVTLLVLAAAGLILAVLPRLSVGRKLAAFFAVLLVTLLLTLAFVRSPVTVVYERYREAMAAGTVQRAMFVAIPYSPTDRLRDQPALRLAPPSREHWMGTELSGADVMSRMIHASRIALSIGFIATGLAVAIGIVIGGVMGYFAGKADMLGMRLIEVFEAIPTLFLLITFVAFFGRNLYVMMVIIGATGWTGYARFVRADFLKLRQQDFVHAAIAAGLPLRSVLFRHMLPNGVTPVLISASFGVASAILAESTLSFLGLGLVDEPSWGLMLSQAVGQGGTFQWWLALFPGLAIFLTVFGYNLIGEALRDALDPKLRRMS